MIRRKKTSHMNTAKVVSTKVTGAKFTTNFNVFRAQKAASGYVSKSADAVIKKRRERKDK